MGKTLLIACLVAIFGLTMADVLPKNYVSKMKSIENEAKALMHMDNKRGGSGELVSDQNPVLCWPNP